MRKVVLACLLLLAACGGGNAPSNVFSDLVACLADRPDADTAGFPLLVDRADAIVRATAVKVDAIDNGHAGAARVTLRVDETAKGTTPPELRVYDAPCPFISANAGESYILFLDGAVLPDGTVQLLYAPPGVARQTPARSLAQAMASIRAIAPLDGQARTLFEKYGWNVHDKSSVEQFVMPALSEFALAGRQIRSSAYLPQPFARYTELSLLIALDPRVAAGRTAELLSFFLEGKRADAHPGSTVGNVLIADRKIVGAWVSLSSETDAFSLTDRAAALAVPSRSGPWTPPPNRVPQGANIARLYDLASATQISFKTGAGGGGDVTDPARIKAFAQALDVSLPTTQAKFDTNTSTSRYYFHIELGARSLALEYDAQDGMLTVLLDGFSAKAPPGFDAVVASLR